MPLAVGIQDSGFKPQNQNPAARIPTLETTRTRPESGACEANGKGNKPKGLNVLVNQQHPLLIDKRNKPKHAMAHVFSNLEPPLFREI
jgi:hypothetical protein